MWVRKLAERRKEESFKYVNPNETSIRIALTGSKESFPISSLSFSPGCCFTTAGNRGIM